MQNTFNEHFDMDFVISTNKNGWSEIILIKLIKAQLIPYLLNFYNSHFINGVYLKN